MFHQLCGSGAEDCLRIFSIICMWQPYKVSSTLWIWNFNIFKCGSHLGYVPRIPQGNSVLEAKIFETVEGQNEDR